MNQNLFITGGTGMVGKDLVDFFLGKSDFSNIYLLIHNKSYPIGEELSKQLHFVKGDITQSRLSLDDDVYRDLTKSVTHIIHAAAVTRFDLSLEEARKINVEGTKNVIDFAKDCGKLKQFGFISTAYVSGKRMGVIREQDRHHNDGFVNTYEQSKYEAEEAVENISKVLPISVYRLSTVIGDSRTGKVNHFTAPHQALRIMYLGLAAMVPGTPEYSVDLIPSDYTVLTLFKLFSDHFKPNQVFHITAGLKKSYTLKELIEESYRYLGEDLDWKNRNYPQPTIASADAFDLFINSIENANNPLILGVMKALKHFAHQLNYPKQFDNANLIKSLPDYEKELPDIRQYYGRVVRYCLTTKWGKNV